jgi:hypothetical protein
MRRFIAAAAVLAMVATVGLSAAVKKYGKPLSVKETTKISDIYAKPDAFHGKRVKVQGPIVDVCAEKGCWIAVGSDKEFQSLRFKVDDGVIVFPMDAKGLTATVEGVVSVTVLSVKEQMEAAASGHEGMAMGMAGGEHKEMADKMAKEKKAPIDPKTITGPKTVIMLKGEAAEVF